MFAVENVFVVFWRMGKPWVGPILSEPIFKIILSLSALNYILSLKKENPLEIKYSKLLNHIIFREITYSFNQKEA